MAAPVRKRRFPIIGDGGGVFSHVHIDDAAAATAIAVDHGRPGVYNIVDDDPAPVREWLPMTEEASTSSGLSRSFTDATAPGLVDREPLGLGKLNAGR
jgi:nucleoside-diphosphate-sugar epimerase